MTEDSSSRQKRRQFFWWSLSLGLLLFVLNTTFFFLLAFSTAWGVHPNLDELSSRDPFLDFKFLLLVSLVFFLAGVALGRWLKRVRLVVLVNIIACLVGSIAMVITALIMLFWGIGPQEAKWIFFEVSGGALFLIITEEVAGVGGGALGGLIGSHFLHK